MSTLKLSNVVPFILNAKQISWKCSDLQYTDEKSMTSLGSKSIITSCTVWPHRGSNSGFVSSCTPLPQAGWCHCQRCALGTQVWQVSVSSWPISPLSSCLIFPLLQISPWLLHLNRVQLGRANGSNSTSYSWGLHSCQLEPNKIYIQAKHTGQ